MTATRSSSRRRSATWTRWLPRRRSIRTSTSSTRPGTSRRRTSPTTSAQARTRSTCPGSPPALRRRRASSATSCPFPIPEIIRHANAFALGVQAVQPDAKVKLVWTKSWFDPAKEKKAAESLVAAGADVIGQNVDSPAAGKYAQSKGLPWVGYNSNSRKFAPTSWQVAAVYDWGLVLPQARQGGCERHLEDRELLGLDGRRVHAAFALRAEGDGQDEGDDRRRSRAAIISGKFYEFQGPLYDQSGKLRVPEGQADDPAGDPLGRTGSSRASKAARRARAPRGARLERHARMSLAMSSADPLRPPAPAPESGRDDARDHEALPRCRRERRRLLRGRRRVRCTRSSARTAPGKRTLLNILTGLYRPDEGEIERRWAARRVPVAARRDRGGHRDGAPALPARRHAHRLRERRPRIPRTEPFLLHRGEPDARGRADRGGAAHAGRSRTRRSGSSRSASSSASRS